jgi:hypothetical protein
LRLRPRSRKSTFSRQNYRDRERATSRSSKLECRLLTQTFHTRSHRATRLRDKPLSRDPVSAVDSLILEYTVQNSLSPSQGEGTWPVRRIRYRPSAERANGHAATSVRDRCAACLRQASRQHCSDCGRLPDRDWRFGDLSVDQSPDAGPKFRGFFSRCPLDSSDRGACFNNPRG